MTSKARAKKVAYIARLHNALETYSKVLLVDVTNVNANQLFDVRRLVEADGALVMGKNTLIRKGLRQFIDAGNDQYESLLPLIRGNIGLAFFKGDLSALRRDILAFRVPAAAKVGQVAPLDVVIPKGNTGLEPTMTSFLHALNIQSKIVRGQIELLADVHLIKAGDKVAPGQVALLEKLKITPFTYGCSVDSVYDNGFCYDASLLSLTDADVLETFANGVNRIAALSLQLGIPTQAAVPHALIKAYHNILAISIETDYTFEGSELLKEMIANPDAFASAAPAASADAAAEAAPVVEEEEEESEEMELDLFG